jgi:acetyl esterase/lipase
VAGEAIVDPNSISTRCVPLWEGPAPAATGDGILDQPMLSVHLPPPDIACGCAIIVCPGGGYRTLASDHEGLQVALWLNRQGIAAFVLRYRLGPVYRSDTSLLDGQRAIRYVRAHAEEFAIASDRVGVLGFSAGGHLSCAMATTFDQGDAAARDPVERYACRPDFIVPVYAVTNGAKRGRKADEYTPTDVAVTHDSAPAFIVTTHEDSIVPASQSTLYYDALLKAGVRAELHIFSDGDHGLGLMPGDPDAGQWCALLLRWLRRRGFLTDAPRIALTGRVTLNGEPMAMVWVSFIPEQPTMSIARVRINRASEGRFELSDEDGPMPGRHRVEVHHVGRQYPHTANGTFSMSDARCHATTMDLAAGQHIDLNLREADFD